MAEYVEAHCGGLDERPVTVPHVCVVYRFPHPRGDWRQSVNCVRYSSA